MPANENIDLVTLEQAKNWIPGANSSDADDVILQMCITAWSKSFLKRTGRGDQDGSLTHSPYAGVFSWNETYDGAGYYRQFVRNPPIQSVTAVTINSVNITASGSFASGGYVVDGTAKSIALRTGNFIGFASKFFGAWQAGPFRATAPGLRFYDGIQNVNIQYEGGYDETPEDIQECTLKVVAQNYRRRSWIDEASRAMAGGAGTVSYRAWFIPPECAWVLDQYTRAV